MEIFIIVHMRGYDIVALQTRTMRKKADEAFDALAAQVGGQEFELAELRSETPGTVRLMGDEVESVQMIESFL